MKRLPQRDQFVPELLDLRYRKTGRAEARRLVTPFQQRIKSPTRYYLVYQKELAARPGVQTVIQWLREQAERSRISP